MKRVLVTNDDGINALGLRRLVEALGRSYEVYVAAPAEQQSAKSMAITFLREVEVTRTETPGAAESYIVDGTPVDCVKWALSYLGSRGKTFDYIFSGINLGANVGIAAYYSGTIGAAREGALNGVRSIAMSVGTHESTHFDYICGLIPKVTEMADTLTPATIISVNAPDLPPWEVRGLRIAEVAPFGYAEEYTFAPGSGAEGDTGFDPSALGAEGTEPKKQLSTEPKDSDARDNKNPEIHEPGDNEIVNDTVKECLSDSIGMFQMGQRSLDGKPSAGKSSEIGPGMLSRTGEAVTEADLRYDLDCMRYGFAAITPLVTGYSDDVALRKLQGRFSTDSTIAVFIDVQEKAASGVEMRNRFAGNIARFAACIRRLDIPILETELYGYGGAIRELRDAIGQAGSGNNIYSRNKSETGARKNSNDTTAGMNSGGNDTHSVSAANRLAAARAESCLRREISAWGSRDFARIMESSSARKVLIAGLETHSSVMQTALDFLKRGYEVTVVEDCCASRQGHDHKLAIERLRDAGCTITTSRAAVMELVGTTGHPAAEAIQRLFL